MQNFFEQFVWAAQRHAARTAVEVQHHDRVDTITYARLREMAERTAAWLAVIGVGPGERCAILADNSDRWCAAYLGVLRRGGIAVPLDTAYTAAQAGALLADAAARVCFTTPRYLETVRAALAGSARECRVVLLDGQADGTVSFDGMTGGRMPAPPLPPCPSRPDDPAVILYTSGTTSDPKGVVLTHGNLLAERAGAFAVVRVDHRDTVLGVLPLFHALAQMANLLLPLSIGARVVFLDTVNTSELLRALAGRGVTILACVPQFFYLIHQRVTGEVARSGPVVRVFFRVLRAVNGASRRAGVNLGPVLFRRVHRMLGGQMRLMVAGGSRFDPAVAADLHRLGFDILQGYGLTETSGAATLTRPGDTAFESVGLPIGGAQVRIAPPEAGGQDAADDGEVLIAGPIVMQGYHNRPEATAAALRDGWLHTGDLGRLDGRGRLTITGRLKEIIVLSSGKNIYPEEVEAAYRRSAFISDICVLGLARDDEPSAERLYAVVVPDEQKLRERKIANVGDLIRFEMEGASVALPHHKRVLGYEIWFEPLPRTSTGKVKRFEVRRRVARTAAARREPAASVDADDQAFLDRPELAAVLELIRRAVGDRALVRPDANLELDLGLDSMERVELLTALEQHAGAEIPEDEQQQLYTVRALAESVLAHAKEGSGRDAPASWAALLSPRSAGQAAFRQWLQPHWLVPAVVYFALRGLRLLLRPGLDVAVSGVAHFPERGPYLICPNHQSYLDPFFLVAALPFRVARQAFFVGATEYFETPLTRWLARQVNLVPVDPDAALVSAMQAGAAGLREGRVLVLFPEGERSIDGAVRTFKKGAAILAHHLQVPIVPVAISGLFEVWPRNRPLNWRALLPGAGSKAKVTIGAAIAPEAAAPAEPAYDALTARLRGAVSGMVDASGPGPAPSPERQTGPGTP